VTGVDELAVKLPIGSLTAARTPILRDEGLRKRERVLLS
jgi:hypothetical protein